MKREHKLRVPERRFWGGTHLASLTLSPSSLPQCQSLPGSTAKCTGSSLCSESVSGITAARDRKHAFSTQKRHVGGRAAPCLIANGGEQGEPRVPLRRAALDVLRV